MALQERRRRSDNSCIAVDPDGAGLRGPLDQSWDRISLAGAKDDRRDARVLAAALRERLRTPAVKLTPAATEAATTHVRLVVEEVVHADVWCRPSGQVRRPATSGARSALLIA